MYSTSPSSAAGAPTVASMVTSAVPIWSTGLGALLLAEHVGWHVIADGVHVIGGIAISGRSGSAPVHDLLPRDVLTRSPSTLELVECAIGRTLIAFAWTAGILATVMPLAVRTYRRTVS